MECDRPSPTEYEQPEPTSSRSLRQLASRGRATDASQQNGNAASQPSFKQAAEPAQDGKATDSAGGILRQVPVQAYGQPAYHVSLKLTGADMPTWCCACRRQEDGAPQVLAQGPSGPCARLHAVPQVTGRSADGHE